MRRAIFFCLLCMVGVALWPLQGCDRSENTSTPAPDPAQVDGRELYLRKCAMCHGNQGKGDGPSSRAYARVADLTDPALHKRRDARQFKAVIKNGIGQMPPVRGLHPVELEALVEYVQTLKAPSDSP